MTFEAQLFLHLKYHINDDDSQSIITTLDGLYIDSKFHLHA